MTVNYFNWDIDLLLPPNVDTLDLQDHYAPSAKDHTRQPTQPTPYGRGPAAPHHTQALRNAEQESYHEQRQGPRVSEDHAQAFPDEPNFFEDPDDELEHERVMHDGSGDGHEADHHYDDGEQMDDDLDDDLMDQISSSPSIDNGKYTLPVWPQGRLHTFTSHPFSLFHADSASLFVPFTSTPKYFPLFVCQEEEERPSHQLDSVVEIRHLRYILNYTSRATTTKLYMTIRTSTGTYFLLMMLL
jgi:hypothetical protein